MESKPSTLAGTSSSNRFVSENSIKEAQERRKEEWAKAYERLGQKPPEDEGPPAVYDPRSLYEKLKEQKDLKQAAFEEKTSIRNQFRALDDEETAFLANVLDEKRAAERERQAEIDNELAKFRQAVSAKNSQLEPPTAGSPPLAATGPSASPPLTTATTTTTKPPPPKKKSGLQQKGLLAGAIKRKSSTGEKEKEKKKASPTVTPSTVDKKETGPTDAKALNTSANASEAKAEVEGHGVAKKRKLDEAK